MPQQKCSGSNLWHTCGRVTAPLLGCRYRGGVDRRHAAAHNGTEVYIEQAVPALTRTV